MPAKPRILPIVATAILLLPVAGCLSAANRPASPWSDWKVLRLDASSAPMFTGRLVLELRPDGERTRLETETTARLLGARIAASRTETVLARSGRPESYVSRSKKRGRRYVFEESGYTVEKLSPVHGPDAPLDEWRIDLRDRFPYPTRDDGRPAEVFDYYGMLLHLRSTDLHRSGDEVTLYVATSGGPTAYTIRVTDSRVESRTLQDLTTGQPRTLEVRALRLRIRPADPERADEGFLKMEGDTELWVEADSKTLLELSGKVPRVPGKVRLRLAAMG